MSNIWKYATLSDRQRMKMIRDGNDDVYTTEKAKNKLIKDARVALGMSTSNIDSWDNAIDDAMNTAKANASNPRANLPKFMSTREEEYYKQRKAYVDKVTDKFEESKSEALEKAAKEKGYISEWLIANGYSKDGNTYKKAQSKIEDELVNTLDKLISEFKTSLSK